MTPTLPLGHELGAEGQFIPSFGTLQSNIFQGHTEKKDISLFPTKDIPMLSCI
jgi:hypothetical protein